MLVLGIETTCDETAIAIVEDGKKILSNVIASSADIHEKYGGVFPELACRRHIEVLLPVLKQALQLAHINPDQIDLIAVAKGPGLIGALLIGMNAAKGLSIAWNKPFVAVSHIEAHLFAAMMQNTPPFPALGLVLSGGHTLMLKVLGLGNYAALGTTVDDAIGESFDKVAALLDLPYPGGPHVEELSIQGNPKAYLFKAGKVKKNPFDFSFSGLKTNVLYAINGQNNACRKTLSKKEKADVAASFQETAFNDIAEKASGAIKTFPCHSILFGGGVCNNARLKTIFKEKFPELPLFWPPKELTTDNAAMIAGLGYYQFLQKQKSDPLDLDAQSRIPIA